MSLRKRKRGKKGTGAGVVTKRQVAQMLQAERMRDLEPKIVDQSFSGTASVATTVYKFNLGLLPLALNPVTQQTNRNGTRVNIRAFELRTTINASGAGGKGSVAVVVVCFPLWATRAAAPAASGADILQTASFGCLSPWQYDGTKAGDFKVIAYERKELTTAIDALTFFQEVRVGRDVNYTAGGVTGTGGEIEDEFYAFYVIPDNNTGTVNVTSFARTIFTDA
jgi:hypothetical protein